jgi:hypothetical protein
LLDGKAGRDTLTDGEERGLVVVKKEKGRGSPDGFYMPEKKIIK